MGLRVPPDPARSDLRYRVDLSEADGYVWTHLPSGLPITKPPYGRITAIDMNRGENVWMQPVGDGGKLRDHPRLAGLDLPPLGGDRYSGPLLTKTLLIHGQAAEEDYGGNRLVARDNATGVVLAEGGLPSPALGTPMAYMHEGRQYIALTLRGVVPEMIAFALPTSD